MLAYSGVISQRLEQEQLQMFRCDLFKITTQITANAKK